MSCETKRKNIPRNTLYTQMFNRSKPCSYQHTRHQYTTNSERFEQEYGNKKKNKLYYFFCYVISDKVEGSEKFIMSIIRQKFSRKCLETFTNILTLNGKMKHKSLNCCLHSTRINNTLNSKS